MADSDGSTVPDSFEADDRETSPDGVFVKTDRVLGQGAFKSVYEGFDTDKCRSVAWCEVFTADMDEEERGKVHREAELLKQLSHPHLLDCFAVWHTDSKLVIITELKKAGDLQEFTRSNRPKLKVIKRWLRDVLEGLAYLHAQQPPVAHRDIKAQNIFYDSAKGHICIGDLGLAAQLPPGASRRVKFTGTAQFMAPELFGLKYDERVDVYAVGMLALQLVTGRLPYCECDTEAHVFGKVSKGLLPQAWQHIKHPSVRQFIQYCCSLEEGQERPSAAEVLQHPFLASVTAAEGGSPRSPSGGAGALDAPPEDEEDELMEKGWEPPAPESKRPCEGGLSSGSSGGAGAAAAAMGAGEIERMSGEGDSDDSDDSDDSKCAGWMEEPDEDEGTPRADAAAAAAQAGSPDGLHVRVPSAGSARQSRSHTPAIVAGARSDARAASVAGGAPTEGSVVTPGVARPALLDAEQAGGTGAGEGGSPASQAGTASEDGDSVRALEEQRFGGSGGVRTLQRSGSAPGLRRLVGGVTFEEGGGISVDTGTQSVGGGGEGLAPQRSLPLSTAAAHDRAGSTGSVQGWGMLRRNLSVRERGGRTARGGASRFASLAEGHETGKGRHRARAFNENRRNLPVESPRITRSKSLPRRGELAALQPYDAASEPSAATPTHALSPGGADGGGADTSAAQAGTGEMPVQVPLARGGSEGGPVRLDNGDEPPQEGAAEEDAQGFPGALTPYGQRVAQEWYLPGAPTQGELSMVMRLRFRPLAPDSIVAIQTALEEQRAHPPPQFHVSPAVPVVTITGGVKLCLDESPEAAAQGLLDTLAVGVPAAYSAHPAALHLLSSAIAALQVCPDATLTVGPVPAWGWVSFALGTQAHTEARFDMEMAAEEADMQQQQQQQQSVDGAAAPAPPPAEPVAPPPGAAAPPGDASRPSSSASSLDGDAIVESPSESSEAPSGGLVRPGPMSPHSHDEGSSVAGTPGVAALTSPLVGTVQAGDGGTGGLADTVGQPSTDDMEPLPPSAVGGGGATAQETPPPPQQQQQREQREQREAPPRGTLSSHSSRTSLGTAGPASGPPSPLLPRSRAAHMVPRMPLLSRADSGAEEGGTSGGDASPGVPSATAASTPVTQAEDDFTPFPYEDEGSGTVPSPRVPSPAQRASSAEQRDFPAPWGSAPLVEPRANSEAWGSAGHRDMSLESHVLTPRATQSGLPAPGKPASAGKPRTLPRTLSSNAMPAGGRGASPPAPGPALGGLADFTLRPREGHSGASQAQQSTLQDMLAGKPKQRPVTQPATLGGGLSAPVSAWAPTAGSAAQPRPLLVAPMQGNSGKMAVQAPPTSAFMAGGGGGLAVQTAPSSAFMAHGGGGAWGSVSAQRSNSGVSAAATARTPSAGGMFGGGGNSTPSMAYYGGRAGAAPPGGGMLGGGAMPGFSSMGANHSTGPQVVFNNGVSPPPAGGGGLSGLGFGDKAMGHLNGGTPPGLGGGGLHTPVPSQQANPGLDAVVAQMQAGGGQGGSTPAMGQPAAGGWGPGL